MRIDKKVILATRPWSFPASVMPVLIGASYVFYLQSELSIFIYWWLLPLILLSAVSFHAAGNIISDYHDARTGVDKLESYGDTNMLLNGTFTDKTFILMGLIWLSLAIICGLVIVLFSSWRLSLFGLFGILCTLLYYRLKYRGFGDIVILLSFGFCIVSGTIYALSGIFDIESVCISVPVSLLTVAILHANNTRDVPLDKQSGIKTFSMVIGLKRAKVYYSTLLIVAYVWQLGMIGLDYLPVWTALILLSVPMAIKNISLLNKVRKNTLEEIAHLDVRTAKLTTSFSILTVLGLVLASL